MKVAVIGGGSTYTPELVNGFLERRASFPLTAISPPHPFGAGRLWRATPLYRQPALSEGEQVENPKWYRAEQKKLRVLQRRVSRRKPGGSNWRKAVIALQRQHERIANRRKDYLNKLAHNLVERFDRIALEDLHISNMAQNRHLSKSTRSVDAGWGYLKLHLAHNP